MLDPTPSTTSLVDPRALLRVLGVLDRLNASTDLGEILELIVDSMRDCLHAERASVFQFDAARQELFIRQAHGASDIRFPISKGIAGEAARTRQIINVHDAWQDARFNAEFDKKTGFRTKGLLSIPLVSYDGDLQGVAQVLNKDARLGPYFDHGDEVIAKALASQAAIALRRATLIAAEIRKNKIEGDLAVARTIQQASLPKTIPQIPGYDVAARMTPADETGGDMFDVMDLQHSAYGNQAGLIFLMGDATGHGIGPALSVAQARAMVRMGVRLGTPIERIAADLNAQLCEDLPAGRFITAFLGHLDPREHHIRYMAPGQAPLLVLRADGRLEERSANALPLGIDTDLMPDEVSPIALAPGDVFLLLSDGFLEATNPAGEQFGVERAVASMSALSAGPAAAMLAALDAAVRTFAEGRAFADDQTAVIVRRLTSETP